MPESHPPCANHEAIARLLHIAGRLKRLPRQGWVDRGLQNPESVADHSWRLALLALLLARGRPDLDVSRAVLLALVHDLPEALAGDVTPFDEQLAGGDVDRSYLFHRAPSMSDVAEEAKTDAERNALREMTEDLPGDLAGLLRDLWEEYESGETPEARFVRGLDKLETWLQAREYQAEDPSLIIESFRLGLLRDVDEADIRSLHRAIDSIFEGQSDS